MKLKLLFLFLLTLSITAFSQEQRWAVGAKLGEPSGLNIRKYFNENAVEVNFGTYGGLWGSNRGYRKGNYYSTGVAFNVNYIWHKNLFGKDKLKGYYGFGPQFNSRKYTSNDKTANGVSSLSVGANALAGLEFFQDSSPISFFIEAGSYLELLPSPFFAHVQAGIGARYNF